MSAGRLVCLVWCPILAASCTSPLLPESDPVFVTRILAAEPGPFMESPGASFRIHVNPLEEEPVEPFLPGFFFYVVPTTRIADSRGGRTVRASTSVLEEGALVAIWANVVLDACAASGAALAIERLE